MVTQVQGAPDCLAAMPTSVWTRALHRNWLGNAAAPGLFGALFEPPRAYQGNCGKVELGATWLHGVVGHPVYEAARALRLNYMDGTEKDRAGAHFFPLFGVSWCKLLLRKKCTYVRRCRHHDMLLCLCTRKLHCLPTGRRPEQFVYSGNCEHFAADEYAHMHCFASPPARCALSLGNIKQQARQLYIFSGHNLSSCCKISSLAQCPT